MNFKELSIHGVWVIEPELFVDQRGTFRRSFCESQFKSHGLDSTCSQGNISENLRSHTLRGFHYQLPPFGESKTLTCLTGSIFDIVLDLREDSPTFHQWISLNLDCESRVSLHIPSGCANAWMTTSDDTIIHYYMSTPFVPDSYCGIRYNDPFFDFKWPAHPKYISDKDLTFPDYSYSRLIK